MILQKFEKRGLFAAKRKPQKNTREIQFYALEKWLKIVFPLSKFDLFWSILMLHNSQTICAKTRKKRFRFFPFVFLIGAGRAGKYLLLVISGARIGNCTISPYFAILGVGSKNHNLPLPWCGFEEK